MTFLLHKGAAKRLLDGYSGRYLFAQDKKKRKGKGILGFMSDFLGSGNKHGEQVNESEPVITDTTCPLGTCLHCCFHWDLPTSPYCFLFILFISKGLEGVMKWLSL